MKLILSVSLPIFFILLSAALGEEYIDYRLVKSAHGRRVARAISENPKCDGTPKPICQNCKDIHMCKTDQSSTFVWTCNKDETCIAGACSREANIPCSPLADLKFICSSEGIFPDPADCFKYHSCFNSASSADQPAKFIHYPRNCTSENLLGVYRFNALTTYCDILVLEPTKVCTATSFDIPLCEKLVQTGATLSNPSVYYFCKKYIQPGVIEKPNSPSVLYPYQYICPNGREYDPASFSCFAKVNADIVSPII